MTRLLVIRLGAMGDLLHVSPSIQQLKDERPEVEVFFLTSPMYVPLVSSLPGVQKVYAFDKKRFWPNLTSWLRQFRADGIDAVVNLHPSFKTWLLTHLLAPRQGTAVYRKQKFKVKGQALRSMTRWHAVRDFYEPFRQLLQLAPTLSDKASIPILPKDTLPPAEAGCPEKITIGIIPGVGARRGNRAWPVEQTQALIEYALSVSPQHQVLLIGGPDEALMAEDLVDAEGRVINTCGRYSILETAKLLSKCHVVVGGDTGPLHLAAAVGVPLVPLYGPTALTRTGPLGRQAIVPHTPSPDLDCWPCELATCPLEGEKTLACMRHLSVAQVWHAVEQVLATNHSDDPKA